MCYNTIKIHVDRTSLVDLSGPAELAELLRSVGVAGIRSHLSDEAVEQVIKVAFYASQQLEEGRYPRCRLFSYPRRDKDDQLRTVAVFAPPRKLNLSEIRRLAHIAPAERQALVVVEQESGQLEITRIVAFDSIRDISKLARPEYWASRDVPDGLMLEIAGPGQLGVSENLVTLHLRAGRIEELASVALVPGVREWLQDVGGILHANLVSTTPTVRDYFGGKGGMINLVSVVWAQILARCVEARHGGAFVVLPAGKTDGVHFKYHLDKLNLPDVIADSWSVSAEAGNDKRELDGWLRSHNRFRRYLDAFAALANVDGCVGLQRGLQLLGFGGEIGVDENSADESRLVFVDARTGEPRKHQDSRQFGGTRHRSAFRLCKKVPGAIAFVISQDGDLRVFYSTEEKVFAFKSLGDPQRAS